MGRSPCCDKVGLKKGPWTPEEDQKLLAYIEEHGHGSWRALPLKAGLQRCGKSCRLRWTNYLRPDIKRGKFSLQEEQTIIQLHALLGNRWSAIATHLPKRTDNEIKNYWNTHLKKRLAKMGIDPVTHKPKNDALLSSSGADGGRNNKNAANLSHMAQWESARLEAEARLVRESKLRLAASHSTNYRPTFVPTPTPTPASPSPHQFLVSKTTSAANWNHVDNLESPTSTISFSETINNTAAPPPVMITTAPTTCMTEFACTSSADQHHDHHQPGGFIKEEGYNIHNPNQDWNKLGLPNNSLFFTSPLLEAEAAAAGGGEGGGPWSPADHNRDGDHEDSTLMEEGCFTNLLLNDSVGGGDACAGLSDGSCKEEEEEEEEEEGDNNSDYYVDNKNYWNSILNLVNSSPSDDHHHHDSPINF